MICYNREKYAELGLPAPTTYKDLANEKLAGRVVIPDITSGGGFANFGAIDYPCNWLQICENTMDQWHTVFLHARVTDIHFGDTWGIAPVTEFYEKLHKIYATLTYRIEDKIWVRSQETISPSFTH